MQVYDVLRVLTARPDAADLARGTARALRVRSAVGALFGRAVPGAASPPSSRDPALAESGTDFCRRHRALFRGARKRDRRHSRDPGGGAWPKRRHSSHRSTGPGGETLLAARDPDMAARLREPDPQRLTRALSVLIATGKSLAHWQETAQPAPLAGFEGRALRLDIDRDELSQRIADTLPCTCSTRGRDRGGRSAAGVLGLDPDLPAMKAIGVREIAAWQAGEMTRDRRDRTRPSSRRGNMPSASAPGSASAWRHWRRISPACTTLT